MTTSYHLYICGPRPRHIAYQRRSPNIGDKAYTLEVRYVDEDGNIERVTHIASVWDGSIVAYGVGKTLAMLYHCDLKGSDSFWKKYHEAIEALQKAQELYQTNLQNYLAQVEDTSQ